MSENKKTMLMTEGNIFKNILFFSVPLILGNLLQQLYNTADSIIVGNCVGNNALAAVGSSTSLIYLLIAFSQGASVGAGVIVSQYLGAGDKKNVHKSVHTALAISVILGFMLSVLGIIFSRKLLVMMNTPEEVLGDAAKYLQIYSAGMIFNVVYNMAAGILNAAGNSKRSLLYLASASVVNIFMDILLIPVFHMGVEGAAIATDMSQAVSCILAMGFLFKVKADYRVELKEIKLHKSSAIRIIQVGLPTGIQNMVISFSNILVQAGVNGFGAMAMAGFGAYMKIDGFNILPVLSFGMAMTTFTGQNYGAGRIDRVKKGIKTTVIMSVSYTLITAVFLTTFSKEAVGLFSQDEEVIYYGSLAIMYFAPFYWILGILQTLAGAVRGTGKTMPPMIILLISLCLFRVLWMKTVLNLFTSIVGIYVLYPVSWAFGAVLMILYVCKGKWLEIKQI